MKKDDFSDLIMITEVQYKAAQRRLNDVLTLEQNLNEQLKKIDFERKSERENSRNEVTLFSRIGSDILWSAYLSKRKARIEHEISAVKARKSDLILEVKRFHSRCETVKELSESQRARIMARHRNRQAWALSELSLQTNT